MILIKYKTPIHGHGNGFSIVEGKISSLKGVGQTLNSKATMIQHGRKSIPIKINKILYQVGDSVSIKNLRKHQQHNKKTVFYKKRDTIKKIYEI